MFITPSFKKSLIVEQFQGNYLKNLPTSKKFVKDSYIQFSTLTVSFILVSQFELCNILEAYY